MNLVRRAQVLNIILAHMTNAADEIERVLFERDPDWRKHAPSPSPTNAPAGFAQVAAEDHLRALAEQGRDPDQAARDYLAQPDERPVIDDAFERALQTHRERHAKPQDASSTQEQPKRQEPPRPNPDNVWGAVHKLRERFGEEAAQVLIEALSSRMDAQAERIAREEAEKIEAKRQADAEREPLEQRVLKIHRAAFDAINNDDAKPAPGSYFDKLTSKSTQDPTR